MLALQPVDVLFVRPKWPDGYRETIAVITSELLRGDLYVCVDEHCGHVELHKSIAKRVKATPAQYSLLAHNMKLMGYEINIINKDSLK